MADTLIRPLTENEPRRKRWTRQECAKLSELGFLPGRYELINGEIIEKMGQNTPHSYVIVRLLTLLSALFGGDFLRSQLPVIIPGEAGKTNEPEPDVAVTVQPIAAFLNNHPRPEELLLVVEVADSSLNFDLHTKALLYASAGVHEYWVVDVVGRRLHVHRNPAPDGYHSTTIHTEPETVSLHLRPEASVHIADLLPTADETPTV